MTAPVPQKLTIEVVPANRPATSRETADQAVRALARIIGRQIAREQFRAQRQREAEDQ